MNLQRKTRQIQRGDIYCADLSPVVGSERGGNRPVLVIQNNTGNHFSPTVIAAAITGHTKRDRQPTMSGSIIQPAGCFKILPSCWSRSAPWTNRD